MWRRGRTRPWSACGSSSSHCAGGRRGGVGEIAESEYLLFFHLTINWYKNGVNKANLWVKEGEDHDRHEVLTEEDGQGEGVLHGRTGPPLNTNRVAAKWWFKCLNVKKTLWKVYIQLKHCYCCISTNTNTLELSIHCLWNSLQLQNCSYIYIQYIISDSLQTWHGSNSYHG